jgi:hypothetical protein
MRSTTMTAIVMTMLAVLVSIPAHAATTTYADYASWSDAAGPATYVDLPMPLAPLRYYPYPLGFTASGVTFNDPNDRYLYVYSPTWGAPADAFSDGSVLGGCETCPGGGGGIAMYLPEATYGVSLNGLAWFGGTVLVTLADGSTFSWNSIRGEGKEYFGIMSTTPLARLDIDSPNNWPMIGDIHYSAVAVAEPATIALVMIGIGAVAALRARRRQTP